MHCRLLLSREFRAALVAEQLLSQARYVLRGGDVCAHRSSIFLSTGERQGHIWNGFLKEEPYLTEQISVTGTRSPAATCTCEIPQAASPLLPLTV